MCLLIQLFGCLFFWQLQISAEPPPGRVWTRPTRTFGGRRIIDLTGKRTCWSCWGKTCLNDVLERCRKHFIDFTGTISRAPIASTSCHFKHRLRPQRPVSTSCKQLRLEPVINARNRAIFYANLRNLSDMLWTCVCLMSRCMMIFDCFWHDWRTPDLTKINMLNILRAWAPRLSKSNHRAEGLECLWPVAVCHWLYITFLNIDNYKFSCIYIYTYVYINFLSFSHCNILTVIHIKSSLPRSS